MTDASMWYDFPNNRLVCQLCVEYVNLEDLYVDDNGDHWDICTKCGEEERARSESG